MTIYQLHQYGGVWEDKYDYIIGSYLRKERAEEEKLKKEQAEALRRQMADKCCICPIYNHYFDDAETAMVAGAKYCDMFSARYDEAGDVDCSNYYDGWMDGSLYRIEEMEVEE